MNLTPREKDKLLISIAAIVARNRMERGVKLNHPEAIAIITDFVIEGARDGKSVASLSRETNISYYSLYNTYRNTLKHIKENT